MGHSMFHSHSGLFASARPGTVVAGGLRHRIRWIQHAPGFHQVGCTCGWVSARPSRLQATATEAGRGHIADMARVARNESKQELRKQTMQRRSEARLARRLRRQKQANTDNP